MKSILDKIEKRSKIIEIDNHSKIVIMSDCHRGIGNNNDNFAKNKNIYKEAMEYYNNEKFTYIELGDGDEMWEVIDYSKIISEYLDIFKLLKKFYIDNRLIMVYGNHDIQKKSKKVLKKYFYSYYNEDLLKDLSVMESLVLNYNNHKILLLHGHQVDFFNSSIINVSKFLVRYLWYPLEYIGIKAPFYNSKNYSITRKSEKKLSNWSIKNNIMVIAGHTHKPIYPTTQESLYFNDGSCVSEDGITCLEIDNGKISLVKWGHKLDNHKVSINRKIIEGEIALENFYLN